MVQAHDPAMLVAAGARYLNQNSSCVITSKPLPQIKKRKPKGDAKKGRS